MSITVVEIASKLFKTTQSSNISGYNKCISITLSIILTIFLITIATCGMYEIPFIYSYHPLLELFLSTFRVSYFWIGPHKIVKPSLLRQANISFHIAFAIIGDRLSFLPLAKIDVVHA